MARSSAPPRVAGRAALALLLVACIATASAVRFDPARLASSVFRYGAARNPNPVVFHRDGKTASVDVTRDPRTGMLALLTNGKVDASYDAKAATPDDYTMVLSAAIPLLLKPGARDVAVVGMGSGRTTNAFLQAPSLARVDTVEIEAAVVDAARVFGPAVARAFDDPRSHVYVEDAKTFFARHRSRYDIIMSEPSNPWVSGVASLFSVEFYGHVRRYLRRDGLFVQWLQLYEFDLTLLASVLEALGSQFDDYVIYATNSGDILIAAAPHGRVPPLALDALPSFPLRGLLETIDVRTAADLALRRIGDKRELARFVAGMGAPANSDYRPYVDQNAVKRRFLRSDATDFERIGDINRLLERAPPAAMSASASAQFPIQDRAAQAGVVAGYFEWQAGHRGPPPGAIDNSLLGVVVTLRSLHSQCEAKTLRAVWVPAMRRFADALIPDLDEEAMRAIVQDLRSARCYQGAPAEVRDWIAFVEAAVLRRDADVRRSGEALAKAARDSDEPVPGVIAREMLAADLRSRDVEAARADLAGLGKALPADAQGRYLRARVEALLDGRQR